MSRVWRDPVTGDELNLGEHLSWVAQGIIRRWIVLGIITVATLIVWALGAIWRHPATDVWNYVASYLALLIEGTVGIAMFSQTRRDAVILRKINRAVAHLETLLEHHGIEQ